MKTANLIVTDQLGDEFMSNFSPDVRRASGSTYTPLEIVDSMVSEAAASCDPDVIVDCGCGSGRFSLAAAIRFPNAKVYAVDSSELACTMCSENVRRYGFESRIEVVNSSFMDFTLPNDRGKALWIGNPPYVRHHHIDPTDKDHFKDTAKDLGLSSSKLAGLHIHFIAHIAEQWREGDFCMLITSAEWMDVNYGAFVRQLLTKRLPLVHMRLYDRSIRLFEGTDSTAVIFSFSDTTRTTAKITLSNGIDISVPLETLRLSSRWSKAIECSDMLGDLPLEDLVPLGTIAAVHRGVVTGNNKFWVRSVSELSGIPETLTTPVVSHAREIMDGCVADGRTDGLKRLITLPADLGTLSGSALDAAQRILGEGYRNNVDQGYVAKTRRAWWSIKPSRPPAVMMTYMARRRPVFIKNDLALTMLNVVHGIYPKREVSPRALSNLVAYLNENVKLSDGRVYCGGLTKFEPKEAESLLVPRLELLEA